MPDDQPLYMDITHHPLADATIDDVRDYPVPQGRRPGPVRRAARAGPAICKTKRPTPWSAAFPAWSTRSAGTCAGWSSGSWTCSSSRSSARRCWTRRCKFWLDWFRAFLDEVGDVVDVIMIGDDLAGQKGPLFRPEFYRSVVKPRHKQLVQYIRSRTKAKIWYHTCGACTELHPRPAGQRHRHPQPGADQRRRTWTPAELKARFGDRLVFWGGGDRRAARAAHRARPRRSASTCGETWRPGSPAAATCSTTSTTSRPPCPRKTSWPCTTRPTSSGSTSDRTVRSEHHRVRVGQSNGARRAPYALPDLPVVRPAFAGACPPDRRRRRRETPIASIAADDADKMPPRRDGPTCASRGGVADAISCCPMTCGEVAFPVREAQIRQ